MTKYLENVLKKTIEKNPHEIEYIQIVEEILESVKPVVNQHDEYENLALVERLIEPERIITFRVSWVDDKGQTQVNRGFRVQHSSLIGPYKGGLRLHPSVNQSIMKFLALEQVFKNALTGLPIGGGKGGSDFDPKGKSDREIMSFCQNFMTELQRHIGQDIDVPAGDIGTGAREIGYMFGQYKKIKNGYEGGSLTGKGLSYGGSLARKEATGFGLAYFMREMLKANDNQALNGKTVIISGSGNVAIYACQKITELGGKVVTMSDSGGCIYHEKGIDLNSIKEIKEVQRGRIKEYLKKHNDAKYFEAKTDDAPTWNIKADIALPCATQNEITLNSAKKLVQNGISAIGEGANMPCTKEATQYLLKNNILIAPAKAVNAGGVATSAIEMSQNSMRYFLSFEEVDQKLEKIMINIFKSCEKATKEYDLGTNYVAGANIAAFVKLAEAMKDQGIV